MKKLDKARKVTDKDISDAKARENKSAETRKRMNKAGSKMIKSQGKAELAKMVGKRKQNVQGKGSKANKRFDKITSQREEREYDKMLHNNVSDWRKDLNEALGVDNEGNHPFVDVMPFMNQKQGEAKRQIKGAAKMKAQQDAENMEEGALNPFQVHFDKDGKSYTSKGSKESRDRIERNIASNRKRQPDPYRARPGESD